MAFTEGSSDGALNGVTPVDIVASPAASTRRVVKCINIQNRDTASVTITLRYVSGANTRQIWKGTLSTNDTAVFGEEDLFILDATNKSITCVMSGAAATTNPDFVASWADVT